MMGDFVTAKQLIARGANPNTADKQLNTPLSCAALKGYIDIARLLLENGANENAADQEGRTALHIVSIEGYPEIVKLLLEHGVNVDARDNDNETALMRALTDFDDYPEYVDTIELLIDHGADVNIKDHEDVSMLHIAAVSGNVRVVKLLIEHGADLNAKDDEGENALDWATGNDHTDIVNVLKKAMGMISEKSSQYNDGDIIECEKCRRKVKVKIVDKSKKQVAIVDPNEIQQLALRCQSCNFITCFSCATGNSNEGIPVCPSCGKKGAPYFFTHSATDKNGQLSKRETKGDDNMNDNEMLHVLKNLCDAYTNNDPVYKELEPAATEIGKQLNERGGIEEMRRIFGQLGGMPGARTLEMHWDGIGDWRG